MASDGRSPRMAAYACHGGNTAGLQRYWVTSARLGTEKMQTYNRSTMETTSSKGEAHQRPLAELKSKTSIWRTWARRRGAGRPPARAPARRLHTINDPC